MAEKQEAKVIAVDQDPVPTYYVSGGWGGISPDGGAIVMYLYHDVVAFPDRFEVIVDEEKGFARLEPPAPPTVQRRVLARLMIPGAVAEGMATWLAEKARMLAGLPAQVSKEEAPEPR